MITLCGHCKHYGPGGQCYLNPPIPLPNGLQMRPTVQQDTRACGGWKAMEVLPVPQDVRPITPQSQRRR